MPSNKPSCFSVVDEMIDCGSCKERLIKNGRTKYGKQRFICRSCKVTLVKNPDYRSYGTTYNQKIVQLTQEGLGIRSTARVLNISPATVIRTILKIAEAVAPSNLSLVLPRIQVDEMHTYIGNKNREVYVIYSWDQESKQALSLAVGTRSKVNLRSVVNPLLSYEVESINTDRYSGYKGVVPGKLHTTFKRRNNGIERQNLNLRTHLKRLNRRTICYSKSVAMLLAVVKIYFWY